MKAILFALCSVTAAFLFCHCNNNRAPVGFESPIRLDSTDSSIFLSYAQAMQDTASYHNLCNKYLNGFVPINFYTVRARDLFAALGVDSSVADQQSYRHSCIRVTLAFDSIKNQFKLFIQPVLGANLDTTAKTAGRALYFRRDGSIDSTSVPGRGVDGSLYVADLNAPCPNTCGQ